MTSCQQQPHILGPGAGVVAVHRFGCFFNLKKSNLLVLNFRYDLIPLILETRKRWEPVLLRYERADDWQRQKETSTQ